MSDHKIRDGIADTALRRLYDYWRSARADGALPARSDIDPLDMAYVLGHVFLVDIEGDPPAFRYRLFGAELAEQAHYELTGKTVDEIPAQDMREVLKKAYARVFEIKEAILIHNGRLLDFQPRPYEALLLPMSTDGTAVDMILGALVYRG